MIAFWALQRSQTHPDQRIMKLSFSTRKAFSPVLITHCLVRLSLQHMTAKPVILTLFCHPRLRRVDKSYDFPQKCAQNLSVHGHFLQAPYKSPCGRAATPSPPSGWFSALCSVSASLLSLTDCVCWWSSGNPGAADQVPGANEIWRLKVRRVCPRAEGELVCAAAHTEALIRIFPITFS